MLVFTHCLHSEAGLAMEPMEPNGVANGANGVANGANGTNNIIIICVTTELHWLYCQPCYSLMYIYPNFFYYEGEGELWGGNVKHRIQLVSPYQCK